MDDVSSVGDGIWPRWDETLRLSLLNSRRFLLAVRMNDDDEVTSLLLWLLAVKDLLLALLFDDNEWLIEVVCGWCSTSGMFVDKLRCCFTFILEKVGGVRPVCGILVLRLNQSEKRFNHFQMKKNSIWVYWWVCWLDSSDSFFSSFNWSSKSLTSTLLCCNRESPR